MKIADVIDERWAEYERRKKRLRSLGLSASEYLRMVRDIAQELKL